MTLTLSPGTRWLGKRSRVRLRWSSRDEHLVEGEEGRRTRAADGHKGLENRRDVTQLSLLNTVIYRHLSQFTHTWYFY